MVTDTKQSFIDLIKDDRKFIETLMVVENKSRRIVPFTYNDIQADVDATETGMDIWVKPAQVGFSTERIAKRLKDTLTSPGTNTILVAYEDFITERLLTKVNFFYNHLAGLGIPGFPEIHHDSTYEKTFRFYVNSRLYSTSSIYIASARSYVAGRAETIHHLLFDECAFYPPKALEDIISPALDRVPQDGTGTVDIYCYDDLTEILTDRGWVRFSNLLPEDMVLTRNDYGDAYYIKPAAYQSFDYHGDMVQFSGRHLDLLVTPNHSVWVQRRFHEFSSEKAKDAMDCSGLSFDYHFGWNAKRVEWITIPSYSYTFGHKEHELPEVKIRMDLWLEYIGFFISEGTLGHNQARIYQSTSSECYDDIRKISNIIAGYLGKGCQEYTDGNGVTHFIISDARLAQVLVEYAEPKRIPSHILALPKEQLEILFNSYMRGDGFSHNPSSDMDRCFTVSEPLADGLQELGLKLGYYSGKYHSKHGNNNPGWQIGFNTGGYPSCRKVRGGMSFEPYSGKVYDITIPTLNHLLMVRRNGKPVWSGNSTPNGEENDFHEMYQLAKEGKSVFKAHFYPWFAHKEYVIPIGDFRLERFIPDTNQPEFKLSSDEELLMMNQGLSFDQIRWRRWKIMEKESLRRSGEMVLLFQQEFPENDTSCFLATGDMYFDKTLVEQLAKNCFPAPIHQDGLDIWYKPEKDKKYMVAIDPGQAKISKSAITVLTFDQDGQGNYKPRYCARDAGLYSPEVTARKAVVASDYYNRAEITWEANSHGLAITELLKNRRPIYFRKDIISGRESLEPGWLTTSKNRDYMLQTIHKYLMDFTCHDIEVAQQMRNHRLVGDKVEVIGANDILMSLAVGLMCMNPHPVRRGYIGRSGWKW